MASMLLAALRVSLGLETDAFEKGSNTAQKEAAKLRRHLEQTAERIGNLGQKMSIGLTAPLVALGAASVSAAQESAQAMAQVNAALESMGPVAGRSADQLAKQAEQLMRISTFDDDEILKSVTANMLTFGNVSGEAFDRAQKAAVNLSVRLGQDLQSSAIQIGKALNDPIKGITALSRVGVSFTEDQKNMIKAMVAAGDTMGAQKIILGELERQYGGAAQAQRDATPSAAFKNAWDNLTETIGGKLLPALTPLLNGLAAVIDKFNGLPPGVQTAAVGLAAFVAAVGPVLMAVGGMISAIGTIGPVLAPVIAAFTTFGTVIVSGVIPALGSLLVALAPFAVPLAALAAAVVGVYVAWKNWDKITAYVRQLYAEVKAWVVDKLGEAFDFVVRKVGAVKDAFFKLYDAVVGHSYVPDMVDGIEKHFNRLPVVMVKVAKDATRDVGLSFKGLEKDIGQNVGSIAKKVDQDLARPLRGITDEVVDQFARMSAGVIVSIDNTVRAIKSGDWVGSILGVLDVVTRVVDVVRQAQGKPPLDRTGGNGGQAPGFATGGSFRVGGQAGIDKNLISFRATKGEMVDIRRPGQDLGGKTGGDTYHFSGNLLTPEFWQQINAGHAAAARQGATGGAQIALQQMGRARQRALA